VKPPLVRPGRLLPLPAGQDRLCDRIYRAAQDGIGQLTSPTTRRRYIVSLRRRPTAWRRRLKHSSTDTPARRTALVGRAREGHFQARPHDVPLFAWTGTTVPRRSRHSSHRSCIATSATFRQPTPAYCASLSTQHIRPSGFSGCWSDGLELTAR